MSCSSCNCSPCVCIPRCATDCPEIVDYSFENQNLGGIGVLDNVTGTVVGFKGVRSTNATLTVADNPALNTIDLTFNTDDVQGTRTFANAAARALAVPDFDGQFGVQLDTDIPYISTGIVAGNWNAKWLFLDTESTTVTGATSVDLVAQTITVTAGTFRVGTWQWNNAKINFHDCLVEFEQETTLDFETDTVWQIGGANIAARRLFGISATAGEFQSYAINTFLSTNNVRAGWGTPTGTEDRTTFVSDTVTLPNLAARVAALIIDLKQVLLPAT